MIVRGKYRKLSLIVKSPIWPEELAPQAFISFVEIVWAYVV